MNFLRIFLKFRNSVNNMGMKFVNNFSALLLWKNYVLIFLIWMIFCSKFYREVLKVLIGSVRAIHP